MKTPHAFFLFAMVALVPTLASAQYNGVSYFSDDINWPIDPALYYTVSGGPPNTCGELRTYRNGSLLTAAGWLCTDANGNATKGPWTFAGTPDDQTDWDAHIKWPDGSRTSGDDHVWDKQGHSVWRTSADGAPPTAWQGQTSDPQWGAGFNDDWSLVLSRFEDVDTGLFWTPYSGGSYSASLSNSIVYGSLSPMPSHSATWSSSFPPAGAHISGHTYQWQTCVNDENRSLCIPVYEFTY